MDILVYWIIFHFKKKKKEFALKFETQFKFPSLEKCLIFVATVCFESENEGKSGSSG